MAAVTFFEDFGFDFAVRCVLSGVRNRMAEVGEVLALCEQVVDGDAASWVREWHALADRCDAIGDEAAAAGRPVSAWPAYLRAANYRFCGSYYLPAVPEAVDEPTVVTAAWRAHRASFDRAVDQLSEIDRAGGRVERLRIPYDGASLPGYRFRADARVGGDGPRPTVVIVNGIGTPMSDVFMTGAADAVDRGFHAVCFDGPGQGAALVEDGLALRADWEHVLGPVLDHVASLDGADPDAVVLTGISHGGWFAARALALAAATPTNRVRPAAFVADPGIIRLIDGVLLQFDDELVARFHRRDRDAFESLLAEQVAAPSASNDLLVSARTTGTPFATTSVYDALVQLEAFDLTGLIGDIDGPTLVCDPDAAGGWPGQSRELADQLAAAGRSPVTRVAFTTAEGAGLDCEILAPELRNQRVYDWMEATLDSKLTGPPADEEAMTEAVGWFRALVVNARDHEQLAEFWQAVLGVGVAVREQDWVQLEAGQAGVYLAFQPLAEGDAPGMHVRPDIEVTDVAEAQARIEAIGGTLVRVVQEPDGDEHRVMADPEGNEFCILPPLPPELARIFPS